MLGPSVFYNALKQLAAPLDSEHSPLEHKQPFYCASVRGLQRRRSVNHPRTARRPRSSVRCQSVSGHTGAADGSFAWQVLPDTTGASTSPSCLCWFHLVGSRGAAFLKWDEASEQVGHLMQVACQKAPAQRLRPAA